MNKKDIEKIDIDFVGMWTPKERKESIVGIMEKMTNKLNQVIERINSNE